MTLFVWLKIEVDFFVHEPYLQQVRLGVGIIVLIASYKANQLVQINKNKIRFIRIKYILYSL